MLARLWPLMLSLILVVATAVPPAQAQSDQNEWWYNYTYAVVQVWMNNNNGGTGTLVWVGEGKSGQQIGYVVTCKHVTGRANPNAMTAMCRWRDGYRSPGVVVATGQAYDTAIIMVRPPPNPVVVPLASTLAEKGTQCEMFGYGGQYGINVERVRLIHWSCPLLGYKKLGIFRLKFRPRAKSGDSGGPVIAKPGVLVGIIAGGELGGPTGPELDTHGPYITPIYNLFKECDPRVCATAVPVAGTEEQQPLTLQDQSPQGSPQPRPAPQPQPAPQMQPAPVQCPPGGT